MTIEQLVAKLEAMGACEEAREWVAQQPTPEAAWLRQLMEGE